DERDLGGLQPPARLDWVEPGDPVELGEHLPSAAPRRPFHLELVRVRRRRIELALDRPGMDDLAALLDDRSERDRWRAVGPRGRCVVAGLLGYTARGDRTPGA